MTLDNETLIRALEHCVMPVMDVTGRRVVEYGKCSECQLCDKRCGVCYEFEDGHATVPISLVKQAVQILKQRSRYDNGLSDMLYAMQAIFKMNDAQRRRYFNIEQSENNPIIAIVRKRDIGTIMNGVNAYRKDVDEESNNRHREILTKLADEVGTHALYKMVKEMRGE